jgi:tetratricopeptide (TPR) repeat protein
MAYDFSQRSLNVLASELVEKGKLQDAKRALELNIAEHPDVWDPHYELARIDEQLGLKNEAIEQYRIVVRMLPQHQGAQRKLRELTGQP